MPTNDFPEPGLTTTSTGLMAVIAINPNDLARLKGGERVAAHAQLLALLAQVSDGEDRLAYSRRARAAWSAVEFEAA